MARCVNKALYFVSEYSAGWDVLFPFGHEVLAMYAHVAGTSANDSERKQAKKLGQRLAQKWRTRQTIPHNIHELLAVSIGAAAADQLGVTDNDFGARIAKAFRRRSLDDLIGFDPRTETVPSDIPHTCTECGMPNARGRKTCATCRGSLEFRSNYLSWTYALVASHHLERFKFRTHLSARDIAMKVVDMRPYPAKELSDPVTWDAAYAVTHLIYSLNEYNKFRLCRSSFAAEYSFLRRVIPEALSHGDTELIGECVDTISAFGHSRTGRLLQPYVEYLRLRQNDDGSWGDNTLDDYSRIHVTWAAIDGIREHRWAVDPPRKLF